MPLNSPPPSPPFQRFLWLWKASDPPTFAQENFVGLVGLDLPTRAQLLRQADVDAALDEALQIMGRQENDICTEEVDA